MTLQALEPVRWLTRWQVSQEVESPASRTDTFSHDAANRALTCLGRTIKHRKRRIRAGSVKNSWIMPE
jgi:hypothetical protein